MKNTIRLLMIFSLSFFLILTIVTVFFLKKNFIRQDNIIVENNPVNQYLIKNKTDVLYDEDELKTISIYESLSPAVVNITVYKTQYYSYFFDIYPEKTQGQGSGAIIDSKGYIVTNYHVVGDADRVTVALSQNDNLFDATIVGTDPDNDLAIIKIVNPPANLTSIPLGESSNLKVGQKVYAIGNPFGLDRTLTNGIISGLGRPIKTDSGSIIEGAIQTDASINPGNSGGPLINKQGQLIGINTMIISPSGGSVGLGFAIPVNTVKESLKDLIEYGYVKRGWIDASFLPVSARLSSYLQLPVSYGLLVMNVARNGEAYRAGLRGGNEKAVYGNRIIYIGGELIVSVDNVKITDYSSLVQTLKNRKPGETVDIEYYRDSKKIKTRIVLIDKGKYTEQ